MKIGTGMAIVGAASVLLAGCHRGEPKGQVVATVNGQEVTLAELNAEVAAANLPASVDKSAVQKQVLQRIIDRKLLVKAAEDKKLDKSAEFLAQKRRSEELQLAQAYARQQLSAVPVPSDSQVSQFMTSHANVFSNREQLTLDQIRFAPPKDLGALKALEGDHSMDAVAQHLTAMGIKFQRGPAGLDTGNAPPKLMEVINKQPGEPIVIPDRGMLTVNVVTSRKPIAIDQSAARTAAVGAWRQQQFQDLIQKQVDQMRNSAKITYQPGFAPPPPQAAKPGAPASIPASG